MTETFDFVTSHTVTCQYSIPTKELKGLLKDNDLDYDSIDREDLIGFIADNIQEFYDYATDDPEYSELDVDLLIKKGEN